MPVDYRAIGTPDGMVEFLKTNVIHTGLLQNARLYGLPEFLELKEKGDVYSGTWTRGTKGMEYGPGGQKIGKIYDLQASHETTRDKAIWSYICDYERNKTRYAVLCHAADFCFTVTMNGCSFGIGTPSKDGSVIVAHSNRANSNRDMSRHQRENLVGVFGQSTTLLEPSPYRDLPRHYTKSIISLNATTFGVRKNSKWEFHTVSYHISGGKWVHNGLIDVLTSTVQM